MEQTKKYTSYAEIEHDLEILKLEKEINYNKVRLSFEKTKDSLVPSNTASLVNTIYQKFFTGTYGAILKILIPIGINWLIKRKRRN